ncbi:hypothetical protein diail_4143 [Diaporthe ilicicola]|nr:hypothetical protein diail_4143 [Diaporthe ilicicola]
MASSDDDIARMLPQDYVLSRDVERVRSIWNPVIHQEMSRHWEMIKEGMRGFKMTHDKIFSTFTNYERNETAELILRDFLDNTFPGALELINEIDPVVNQYPSRTDPEAIMVCDYDDNRSVTMDLEAGPSSRRHGDSSMGPPPRPVAPLTPVTPAGLRDTADQGAREPPSVWDHPDSPSSGPAPGTSSLRQTAKRSLHVMEFDSPRSPESPTKKAKSSTGSQPAGLVTKTADLWEVEGEHYIFKDKRCGPGWHVVLCTIGEGPEKFHEHPLENNVAINHFNPQDPKNKIICHDTSKKYTLDEIIRDFTYRVFDSGDELSEKRVKSANERLQRENPTPQGSAKKQRKGKERAVLKRFTATNTRQGTADSDGSYQAEMTQDVIDEFLAEV